MLKGMARSTFFYHLHQKPDRYAEERKRIKALHALHKGRYGYRRITAQMKNEGYTINRKTVYRIMKELGLKNVRRKCKYRSYKGEVGKTAPNRLKRNFNTKAPNRKWTTDVTQINIGQDKCYLSPILDMYNGEIVCYTITDHPDLKMVMDMLSKAYEQNRTWKRLILHSDQGSVYSSKKYNELLPMYGITRSMSRAGTPTDNAAMEAINGWIKAELFMDFHVTGEMPVEKEVDDYITFFNEQRPAYALSYLTPKQYRESYATTSSV